MTPVENRIQIDTAGSSDLELLRILLRQEGLPADDLATVPSVFLVIREQGKLVAGIGLETYASEGLLRSLVVDPGFRSKGFASALLAQLLNHARQSGLQHIFLLTETAEAWFARKGFIKADRSTAPQGIRDSSEFSQACPASASFMKYEFTTLPES